MPLFRAALAVLLLFAPSAARAACQIGSFDAATSIFFLDLNDNGIWDGVAGGDASSEIASFAGPGISIVGDWNGDGVDDTGKVVGTRFYLDLNGNRDWDGNAGGDRNTDFAPSFGAGTPVVGDWNGDGADEIGVYMPGGEPRFLLDATGNGVWNGKAGGDRNGNFPAVGSPLIANWNGDRYGNDVIAVAPSGFLIDANGNFAWNGNGSSNGDPHDVNASFRIPYAPSGPRLAVAGDWFGIGRDTPGVYYPLDSTFFLDGNGSFGWDSGDGFGQLGLFTGTGTPLVCDWDGDGDTDIGKVVGGNRFLLDRNGDRYWNGTLHGDRSTVFDVGAPATPLVGRWVSP